MGALEIRRASAQLNGLGQFRMPELDTGAARAFEAQARAAQTAADAAATAGRAAVNGITERGRVVANTLAGLGKLAMDLYTRENERVATNAFIENEKERNLFMYGDGTAENPGAMNQPFGDAVTWLGQLKDENERRLAARTKDMNAAQRRLFMDKVSAREVEWQLKIGSYASAQTIRNETATAVENVQQAREHAIACFADKTFRDKSIAEFYDAKNRELDVRLVPQGERAAEMRKATEDLLLNLATRKFTEWETETFDNADPAEVERLWTERAIVLESLDGRVPTNELIRRNLGGDTVDEAHQALVAKRFAEAKTAAVARSHALQNQNWRNARNEAVGKELELMKEAVPEDEAGKKAYYSKLSVGYAKIAENPLLSPHDRLTYLETSRRIGEAASDKEKAYKKKENDTAFRILNSNIEFGWRQTVVGNSESYVPYTHEEMKRDVDGAFAKDLIDVAQWSRLSGIVNRKYTEAEDRDNDEVCKTFMTSVIGRYGKLFPSAIKYHADRNIFAFEPSAATMAKNITTKTPIPDGPRITWGPDDVDQIATYGQFVQVLNAVKTMRRNGGMKMSVADMEKQFDAEFGPTARGRAARSAAEKISMLENASEAWRE